jgi:DNA-binding response OmpR family regulator
MTATLVVEANHELGESIVDVLCDEGFVATWARDYETALTALQLSPMPLIALLGHGGCSALSARILQHIAGLPRHGYVLVSTRAAAAPRVWNPHTARRVPVVAAPFDIEDLADQVRAVAAELTEQVYRPPHDELRQKRRNAGRQGALPASDDPYVSVMQSHDAAGVVSWHASL